MAKNHFSTIGCRPVYDIWNSTYLPCDSKEKNQLATFPFGPKRNDYVEPCQSADKIIYDYQETNVNSNDTTYKYPIPPNSFQVMVVFPGSKFKVILHKAAYDFLSLIGNGGGYVGLFLGIITSQ